MSTSSPSTGNWSAVCTALPNGSKIAATSRSTPSWWCQTLVIGSAIYSAKAPARFTPRPNAELLASAEDVLGRGKAVTLIDSRAPARYRGDSEPIDRRAGHIPGAINLDWSAGQTGDGAFKTDQAGRFPEGDLILYCGSGVSAAANLLSLAESGRPPGPHTRLYAGSWSDWVSDDARPVASGDG